MAIATTSPTTHRGLRTTLLVAVAVLSLIAIVAIGRSVGATTAPAPVKAAALPIDNRTPDAIDRVLSAAVPVDNRTPDAIDRVVTPASSSTLPLDAAVAKAAATAGLVMMCQRGQLDSNAESAYQATAAVHPDLAAGIGPDCSVSTVAP